MFDRLGKKRVTILLVAVAFLLCMVVLGGFLSGMNGGDSRIVMPSASAQGEQLAVSAPPPEDDSIVTVSKDNAADVLSTLSEPGSYHRSVMVETIWSGGSATRTVQVWKSGSLTRVDISDSSGQMEKSLIITGESIFSWGEDGQVLELPIAEDIDPARLTLLPDRGELLGASAISEADYVVLDSMDGEQCLYVQWEPGQEGYSMRYWVSLSTGLVVQAHTIENGNIVRNVQELTMESLPATDDEFSGRFSLPDGTQLPLTE